MQTYWEELFRQGQIWDVTRDLIDCLMNNVWPSPTVAKYFGIVSQDHFDALRNAILVDCSPNKQIQNLEELDRFIDGEAQKRYLELNRALQHGARLTEFVQKHVEGQLAEVKFDTGMDEFVERVEKAILSCGL